MQVREVSSHHQAQLSNQQVKTLENGRTLLATLKLLSSIILNLLKNSKRARNSLEANTEED